MLCFRVKLSSSLFFLLVLFLSSIDLILSLLHEKHCLIDLKTVRTLEIITIKTYLKKNKIKLQPTQHYLD